MRVQQPLRTEMDAKSAAVAAVRANVDGHAIGSGRCKLNRLIEVQGSATQAKKRAVAVTLIAVRGKLRLHDMSPEVFFGEATDTDAEQPGRPRAFGRSKTVAPMLETGHRILPGQIEPILHVRTAK